MAMRGVTAAVMSDMLNLSESRVNRELQRATKEGWLEEARQKMQDAADLAPNVLKDILTLPAAELHASSKGWTLKSEVARALATGTGIFTPEVKKTVSNLHEYFVNRGANAPAASEPPIEAEITGPAKYFTADPGEDD